MGEGIEFIGVSVLAVHLYALIEKRKEKRKRKTKHVPELFSSGTAERGV